MAVAFFAALVIVARGDLSELETACLFENKAGASCMRYDPKKLLTTPIIWG